MLKLFSGVALAALAVVPANAATFMFSFTGTNVSGSGFIYTADNNNVSTVTRMTGAIYDSEIGAGPFTITALSSYAGASNLLYRNAQPYVDFGGISFTTDRGGDFNLGLGGGGFYGLVLNASRLNPFGYGNGGRATSGSTDVGMRLNAVPEPATWAMMIGGFALVGTMIRRRRRSVGSVLA